jgi:GT2 family glycosyltransferase
MNDTPDILLLCVNYKNPEETRNFLKHVRQCAIDDNVNIRVVVSDNDGSMQANASVPGAMVVTDVENPGYFSGCAFALEKWQRQWQDWPRWIGVVNTDIEFQPGFFTRLLSLRLPENLAAMGPDIRLPDNTPQNPFKTTRPSISDLKKWLFIFKYDWLFKIWDEQWHKIRKNKKLNIDEDNIIFSPQPVYAIHGSAIFLRPTFFKNGGTLKYPAFLYGEELFLAEQIQSLGMNSAWMPGLKIIHKENSILGVIDISQKRIWKLNSMKYIFETYFDKKG